MSSIVFFDCLNENETVLLFCVISSLWQNHNGDNDCPTNMPSLVFLWFPLTTNELLCLRVNDVK